MKIIYFVDNLYIVRVKNEEGLYTKLICEVSSDKLRNTCFKEIFTGTTVSHDDEKISSIDKLSEYYPNIYTPKTISKNELFIKYTEINRVEMLLTCTDEIIEEKLKQRGIFEQSSVYQKKKKRNKKI